MYENIRLFRRRFIPDELVFLKDDEIVSVTEDKIVTAWKSLSPRRDFAFGESTYYRKKGLKVSKIMDKDKKFLHWYIDIVRECGREGLKLNEGSRLNTAAAEYLAQGAPENDEIIVYEDLLLDVQIEPGESVRILDMDEVVEAFENGLITEEMLSRSMHICNDYVKVLYERFGKVPVESEEFARPE